MTGPLYRPSAILFYTPDTVVDLCAYFDAVSYRPGLAFPGSSLLGRAAGDTGLYHRTSQPAKSYQQRQTRNKLGRLARQLVSLHQTGPRSALVGPWTVPTGYLICLSSRLDNLVRSGLAGCLPPTLAYPRVSGRFRRPFCILHAPVRRPRFGLPLSALYPWIIEGHSLQASQAQASRLSINDCLDVPASVFQQIASQYFQRLANPGDLAAHPLPHQLEHPRRVTPTCILPWCPGPTTPLRLHTLTTARDIFPAAHARRTTPTRNAVISFPPMTPVL